jgi:hypothetical protein
MKRILYYFALVLAITSCTSSYKKTTTSFKYIEVTFGNGLTKGFTTYIDSNKVIERCNYYIAFKIDSIKCYRDTLKDNLIDSLNNLLALVMKENIDSINFGLCIDCCSYTIRILMADKLTKIRIKDSDRINLPISKLARFITKLKVNDKYLIQDKTIFESTKMLIPPTLMKTRKFLPPNK